MASKLMLGAVAAITAPMAVIAAVAIMVSTTGEAQADPALGPYGSQLKPGSVPAQYAPWIEKAAGACPGLPAPILAAQLQQESGFNPNAVSHAEAQGIAQFMPGTWPTWAVDADGDGVASPFDPPDAIMAQGRFMCALLKKAKRVDYPGTPIELALAGYNAGWGRVIQYRGIPPYEETRNYVKTITAAAKKFTAPAGPTGPVALPAGFSLQPGTPKAVATAINWALKARGGWYQWGGTCTDPHSSVAAHRCDCSSLLQAAYEHAGISIPRVTYDQVKAGRPVRDINHPQPGDLVFIPGSDGTAARPGHVGMYIGQGYVIEAPGTNKQVRIITYHTWRNAPSTSNQVVAVRRIV